MIPDDPPVPDDPPATNDGPASALPPRAPRSFAVHVAIDTAVAFLATVVLGLILGVPFLAIAAIAIVAGVCLAPLTRRTELRQLARRAADPAVGDDEP
jgi:hypothetical protein